MTAPGPRCHIQLTGFRNLCVATVPPMASRLRPTQDGCFAKQPSKTGMAGTAICGSSTVSQSMLRGLSQLDLCASCFQLGFDFFGFCFRSAFFDFATSFDEVFGFFQAKTCDAANFFDDVDF